MKRLVGLLLGGFLGNLIGTAVSILIMLPETLNHPDRPAGMALLVLFVISGVGTIIGGLVGLIYGPRLLKKTDLKENLTDQSRRVPRDPQA